MPWLSWGFRAFLLVLVAGLIFLLTSQWNWWVGSAITETTDDAYLQADLTPLAAKVSAGPPTITDRVPAAAP